MEERRNRATSIPDLKRLAVVLALGLLIRYYFWSVLGVPFGYDVLVFFLTGENLVDGLNFYSFQAEHFYDYFNYQGIWYRLVFGGYVYAPPWGLDCSLLVLLSDGRFRLFGPSLYSFLAVCDIGLALVTYLLARQVLKPNRAYVAALLSVLSPLFYAAEGQFDTIPTLFSALSLLFLMRNPFLSGALLGVCIAYKYYGGLLLVSYLILLLKEKGRAYAVRFLISSLVAPAVFIVPFMLWDWRSFMFNMTFWDAWCGNATPWLFVYRFFGLDWRTKEKLFVNPTLTIIHFSSLLLTLGAFFMVVREVRQGTDPVTLSLASLLCLLVFNRLVHINYLCWIFPFLIVKLLSQGTGLWPKVAYMAVSLVPFYHRFDFELAGIPCADLLRAVLVPSVLFLLFLTMFNSLRRTGRE